MRQEALSRYLEAVLGGAVEVQAFRPLGIDQSSDAVKGHGALQTGDLKAFGYGRPIQSRGVER